jgi:hypothetical protein
LSEKGKTVFNAAKEGEDDSKVIVLTTGNMRTFFYAVFTRNKSTVLKALNTIAYRMKRYAVSFFSCCKKWIPSLAAAN